MKCLSQIKMYKKCMVVWIIISVLLTGCGANGLDAKEKDANIIIWAENEDGSYTFTNTVGEANAEYAWYILDETGEVIEKTKYSESPDFVYDLQNNRNLSIKSFVKIDGEQQSTQKINAVQVLGLKEYAVKNVRLSQEAVNLIEKQILESRQDTLPVEDIKNGIAWGLDIKIPVEWTCSATDNRSCKLKINALSFLDDTYRAWKRTADTQYADMLIDYVIDWADQNKEYIEDEWQWHDDATARRVQRMAVFYNELRNYCSEEEQKLIEKSLAYQAELLASDEFYTWKHNHGMHQDIALLTYALLFEKGKTRTEYTKIALNRVGYYMDYVYTNEGIHKEHSPYYARDMIVDAQFLQKITKEISPDFSWNIQNYIEGAQEYLIQIIKPDGNWSSVGDSSAANGILTCAKILKDNKEYQWVASNGQDGIQPPNECVYKNYAIFRSSWTDADDEATWMLFNAASFSSTHKHSDDLEVLLYHKGDLFVEAGKRDYNYADLMTSWAYSGYAHNVLLVNGEPFPVKVGANGFQSVYPSALKTAIIDYEITEDKAFATGYQCRFENVEQTRTLVYNRTNDKVLITDLMEATEDYDGTLLWHIAEDVTADGKADGWNFYRDGNLIATMDIVTDTKMGLETITGGGKNYPFTPWIFNGNEEPVYGTLLKVNFEGRVGNTEVTAVVQLK